MKRNSTPPTPRRPIPAAALFLAAALAAALGLAGCNGDGDAEYPECRHVLLLTVDTLRADYMGIYGYDLPVTPALDGLLGDGVRFTRAVTPCPRTTQALASLLTGAYPHTTGVRTLIDTMAPDVVSLAEIAKGNGYATAAVVSNHLLTRGRGLWRGFDVYDPAPDIRHARATNESVRKRLAGKGPDDKIFLWVHYIDPHVPYFPPPDLAAKCDPGYEGPYKLNFGQQPGGIGKRAYPEDLPKAQAVFENRLPDRVNEHIRRLYAADIMYTDQAAGELLAWLRETFGDDWIVVFTSDHGESLGEHDYFFDHGDYVYDAGLRVPLGFVFPDGHPLRRSGTADDWVSLVDVAPTLVEVLGLNVPQKATARFEGRSLAPLLRGESMPPRPVFAESGKSFFPDHVPRRVRFDVAGRFRAAMHRDWKLIWTPFQQADQEYELYNMKEDPRETRDLYDPQGAEARSARDALEGWMQRARAGAATTTLTDEERARLKALGYIDG